MTDLVHQTIFSVSAKNAGVNYALEKVEESIAEKVAQIRTEHPAATVQSVSHHVAYAPPYSIDFVVTAFVTVDHF